MRRQWAIVWSKFYWEIDISIYHLVPDGSSPAITINIMHIAGLDTTYLNSEIITTKWACKLMCNNRNDFLTTVIFDRIYQTASNLWLILLFKSDIIFQSYTQGVGQRKCNKRHYDLLQSSYIEARRQYEDIGLCQNWGNNSSVKTLELRVTGASWVSPKTL